MTATESVSRGAAAYDVRRVRADFPILSEKVRG
jgi:hypothetical protein